MARVIFSTGSLYVIDLAYVFELVAEAGYDGVEVMCDDRYSTRDPEYLAKLSTTYDLPILSIHTPFSPRLMGWNGANHCEVERILCTLKLAEQLGAESIVVHVPRKIGMGSVKLGRTNWNFPWQTPFLGVKYWIEHDLPQVQQQTPVKIALENMPTHRILGREVDPTWYNELDTWSKVHDWLTLDTTHWATKSISPTLAYEAARGRVWHVHLSNYDGLEHRLPHRGHVDLANFLRTLAEDSFAGTISVELSPDALEFDNPMSLRRNMLDSLNFCRQHLGQR